MDIQADLASGTQLLSQSIYESILKKTRGAPKSQQNAPSETQRTYEEGDTGHVDIMSSFVTGHEQLNNSEDSDPTELSPVQTQHALTQYPESQRFKTPATIGKKRTYTGDVVTPAVPRNPLAQEGQRTPAGMLGLSQAFAATQAASSPFSNALPTGPRSDRPSPTIDLQEGPATAVSSSPLRPISDFRRSATEPASKYVPMRHSQAERERQNRLQLLEDASGGIIAEDEFDQESSLMARRRRQKEREKCAKEELRSLSSPIIPARDMPSSSPIVPLIRESDTEESTATVPTPSAPAMGDLPTVDADFELVSEADTETEQTYVDVRRSSQLPPSGGSNKENEFVLVPKTGPRSRHVLQYDHSEIDASPSVRRIQHDKSEQIVELLSSEPLRIMDSQPSQTVARLRSSAQTKASPVPDNVGVIGQSDQFRRHPVPNEQGNAVVPNLRQIRSEAENDTMNTGTTSEDQKFDGSHHSQPFAPTVHDQSVPEAEWESRTAANETVSLTDEQVQNSGVTNNISTHYETARTHLDADTRTLPSEHSSPIHATPPGRKRRRRLLEISAEPSPQKLQSQPSFDAGAVLVLDADEDVASLLQTSPLRSSPRHVKTHRLETRNEPLSDPASSTAGVKDEHEQHRLNNSGSHEESSGEISATENRGPARPERLESSLKAVNKSTDTPRSPSHTRLSIFDIQASPEQAITPKLVRSTVPSLRSKAKLKTSRNTVQREPQVENRLDTAPKAAIPTALLPTSLAGASGIDGRQAVKPDARTSSASTDVMADPIVAPHMVFAYYGGDPRGYYPARIVSTLSTGFRIEWDGYEPEEVDSYAVKALDLRLGDVVKVLANGFKKVPYVIRGFKGKAEQRDDSITDTRGYQTVILAPKQRKSLPNDVSFNTQYEVPVANLYLDTNMWAQMKSRTQQVKPMVDPVHTSGVLTPVGRGATPSTPSSRGRRQTGNLPTTHEVAGGIFDNMTFAISYDDTARKDSITFLIQNHGGMILHGSFHDLVESDSIALRSQYSKYGFTALLTDRHSRKEKYMQALALGLPCLSGRWIEACAKHNSLVDWQAYLLPAGESIELDNFTRSRVLPSFDTTAVRLSEMLDSRPKIFDDEVAIIVMGRGKAETKRSPYAFLVKVLGIQRIEKVPDLKSAQDLLNSGTGAQYAWVFVDDKEVSIMQDLVEANVKQRQTGKKPKRNRDDTAARLCRVAGNELIVQSLILSKLCEP